MRRDTSVRSNPYFYFTFPTTCTLMFDAGLTFGPSLNVSFLFKILNIRVNISDIQDCADIY